VAVDKPWAVGFDFVGDGADEAAFPGAHFGEGFGDTVLADDGEIWLAAGLASGIENAEGG
jgi:hypothetical protein